MKAIILMRTLVYFEFFVAGICGVRLQKKECTGVGTADKYRAAQKKSRSGGRGPQSAWPHIETKWTYMQGNWKSMNRHLFLVRPTGIWQEKIL
jgi:hypothetical protein